MNHVLLQKLSCLFCIADWKNAFWVALSWVEFVAAVQWEATRGTDPILTVWDPFLTKHPWLDYTFSDSLWDIAKTSKSIIRPLSSKSIIRSAIGLKQPLQWLFQANGRWFLHECHRQGKGSKGTNLASSVSKAAAKLAASSVRHCLILRSVH